VKSKVIVDTGPLVALLTKQEEHHAWTQAQFDLIEAPLLTCEAVITEAMFVMRDRVRGREQILQLLKSGLVSLDFNLRLHVDEILSMVQRYNNVPMSLADACLVRMSELLPQSHVFTLDSDFHVYRKNTRHVIPTITPRV
jgi:predicted nucleic acid-binding protein